MDLGELYKFAQDLRRSYSPLVPFRNYLKIFDIGSDYDKFVVDSFGRIMRFQDNNSSSCSFADGIIIPPPGTRCSNSSCGREVSVENLLDFNIRMVDSYRIRILTDDFLEKYKHQLFGDKKVADLLIADFPSLFYLDDSPCYFLVEFYGVGRKITEDKNCKGGWDDWRPSPSLYFVNPEGKSFFDYFIFRRVYFFL